MKIYTRTGDDGTTSLVGGRRVSKTHIRLEAYGTLDELNAQLGVLCTYLTAEKDKVGIMWVQKMLFVAGTLLAVESDSPCVAQLPVLTDGDVSRLEQMTDEAQEGLPSSNGFVLPGGSRGGAVCHVCRTVCRRAERRVWVMVENGCPVDETVLRFLNRLSDYLFVLSRRINRKADCDEFFWNNACD